MKKKLVFSLENTNLKSSSSLLIAGEWVLELNKKKIDNLNYEVFYSSSFLKKNRILNTLNSDKIFTNIINMFTETSDINIP